MKKLNKIHEIILGIVCFSFFIIITTSCEENDGKNLTKKYGKKIGVLLVNHGSHSETWRKALLDLEDSVRITIFKNKDIEGIKTAFMEYNEPSIATRLKEFDSENFTDVIIVPIFLTVSSHSFDDIPTIIGAKNDKHSMELLKIEKIERYTPKAKIHITPLLNFTNILQRNIVKRVESLTQNSQMEGLVLIAYGDKTYNKEWSALLEKVGNSVKEKIGIDKFSIGWCGHVAHYNPDSTTIVISKVLEEKEKAIVIPVLVAHDEMFQIKIIGDGISKVPNAKRKVIYKPDAILPDKNIQNWIIEVTNEFANKISNNI
ncbi:MAG: CbiX/SirB N-terminal domain-containing protein [Melioribacteraceae bacterium]